ncbi:hypothetical protein [Streptomyces sp. 8N616]|uniref:hypothetical protein n=1 Tax=Streptomyces sp. 8N616 TaxID=3457414 RepID=UPI003FD38CCD
MPTLREGVRGSPRESAVADTGDRVTFRDRFTGRVFTPTPQQRRDFAELTAANELDIARINPRFRARCGPELLGLFTRLRPLLSEQAWQDCRAVLS